MTKKNFEIIAKALKDTCYMNDVNHISISPIFIEFLLLHFKEENKNFDEKRFLDACNLEWDMRETKDGEKIKFKLRIKEGV
jgi:hypothetical protein|tara:strand:+ start:549 stop:791 length:243 start_codon:yes stop_codon:yes gene_type:complete